MLVGSWRTELPPFELDSDTLPEIALLLENAGVGALAWRRIRGTSLADTRSAVRLQHIHRYNTLQNAIHAESLKTVLLPLRAHGIEPVLVKGWSLAPLYPE